MDLLVNIDVDDVERAIAFYGAALGLTVKRRFDGGFTELTGATARIFLLPNAAGTAPFPGGGVRDYARHWTPLHLDFVVEDVDAAVERACAAGAKLESGILPRSWGRIAILGDPFGHGFCLLEFVGDDY